jgi:hypothetical protein
MLDRITPEREAALARFWERYIEIIHNQGVKEPFDRWYVIRAQAYIDARPGLRLKAHQASDLTDYLNALGRKSDMKVVCKRPSKRRRVRRTFRNG